METKAFGPQGKHFESPNDDIHVIGLVQTSGKVYHNGFVFVPVN